MTFSEVDHKAFAISFRTELFVFSRDLCLIRYVVSRIFKNHHRLSLLSLSRLHFYLLLIVQSSLECISSYCRLQFSLPHYHKKSQTQNLRWSLKNQLNAFNQTEIATEELRQKRLLRKLYEVDFAKSHI